MAGSHTLPRKRQTGSNKKPTASTTSHVKNLKNCAGRGTTEPPKRTRDHSGCATPFNVPRGVRLNDRKAALDYGNDPPSPAAPVAVAERSRERGQTSDRHDRQGHR